MSGEKLASVEYEPGVLRMANLYIYGEWTDRACAHVIEKRAIKINKAADAWRDRAVKEWLDEACKAVCQGCRGLEPIINGVHRGKDGNLSTLDCYAKPIRKLSTTKGAE